MVLRLNYPDYNRSQGGKIDLRNGALVLEPLEVDTRRGVSFVTARSAWGLARGHMSAHGIIRGTFRNGSVFYFDLGSSTHLGNYGGADHIFFDDTPGFLIEMDLENAKPYFP